MLITFLQLFAVGFTLGFTGPCVFLCVPAMVPYIAGRGGPLKKTFVDTALFLIGRFSAAILYGAIAGTAGGFLRVLPGASLKYIRPAAGAIILLMAVYVLAGRGILAKKFCPVSRGRIADTGVFFLGLLFGLAPCPPFIAVFTEIMLMSQGAVSGVAFGAFFGAGLFVSGLLIIGVSASLVRAASVKMIRTRTAETVFRILCALIMAAFSLQWFF